MDTIIRSLSKEFYSPLEEIHTQFVGNFDNPIDLDNFRRYVRLRSHLVRIAVQNSSSIVGYIIGDRKRQMEGNIFSLYVLPNFRKRQIGTGLLIALEKEFHTKQPNIRYLSARIPEEFFNSSNFFLKQGFEIITKINNYVKNDLSFPYEMNPNLKIKMATKSNLQDLIKIEKICFPEYWQKNSVDFMSEIRSETSSLFVAFLEGKLVGYNINAVSASRTDGHYIRIATHPKFRRRHIGTSLTVKAFQWFKKQRSIQRILLSTYSESNFHNAMYKGWGFKFVDQEMIVAKEFNIKVYNQ